MVSREVPLQHVVRATRPVGEAAGGRWSSGTIDLARQRWVRLTTRKVCTVYIPDGLQVAAFLTSRRRSAARMVWIR